MEAKRCPNGHYYDSGRYASCPVCSGMNTDDEGTVAIDGNFPFAMPPFNNGNPQFGEQGYGQPAWQGSYPPIDPFFGNHYPGQDAAQGSDPSFAAPGDQQNHNNWEQDAMNNNYYANNNYYGNAAGAAQDPPTLSAYADEEAEPGATVAYGEAELGFVPTVGWVICISGPQKGKDFRLITGYNRIGRTGESQICLSEDNQVSRESHALIAYDPQSRKFFVAGDKNMIYLNGNFVISSQELKPNDRIKVGATELMFVPLCGDSFQWE